MKRLALLLLLATAARAQAPAAPVISPAPGTYTGSVTITISDATPGAVIYYTTDLSIPTQNSTLYTGAFTLTAGKTIRATAYVSGSQTATASYSVVQNFPFTLGTNKGSLAFAYQQGGNPASQTVYVWDSSPCPPPAGVPMCNWPVTVSADQPWIVTTGAGKTGFVLGVSIDTTALKAGTYSGAVTLTQPLFKYPSVRLQVTVTVAAPPPPPPLPHSVSLSWGSVAGADLYTIYRSTVSGGPYTSLGTSTLFAMVDKQITSGAHYCYALTETQNALESVKSNEICVDIPTP